MGLFVRAFIQGGLSAPRGGVTGESRCGWIIETSSSPWQTGHCTEAWAAGTELARAVSTLGLPLSSGSSTIVTKQALSSRRDGEPLPVNGQWNRVVYTRMVRSPRVSPAKCCPGRGERVGGGHPAAAEADWPPPCRRASGGAGHGTRRGRPQDAPRCGRRSGAEVAVGTLPSEVAGRSRVRLCPAARDVGPGTWDRAETAHLSETRWRWLCPFSIRLFSR